METAYIRVKKADEPTRARYLLRIKALSAHRQLHKSMIRENAVHEIIPKVTRSGLLFISLSANIPAKYPVRPQTSI